MYLQKNQVLYELYKVKETLELRLEEPEQINYLLFYLFSPIQRFSGIIKRKNGENLSILNTYIKKSNYTNHQLAIHLVKLMYLGKMKDL